MNTPDLMGVWDILCNLVKICSEQYGTGGETLDEYLILADMMEDAGDPECESVRGCARSMGTVQSLEGLQFHAKNPGLIAEVLYNIMYFVDTTNNPWYEFKISVKNNKTVLEIGPLHDSDSSEDRLINRIDPQPFINQKTKGCPHFFDRGLACDHCGTPVALLTMDGLVSDQRFRRMFYPEYVRSHITKQIFKSWVLHVLEKGWPLYAPVADRIFCTSVLYLHQLTHYNASVRDRNPLSVLRQLGIANTGTRITRGLSFKDINDAFTRARGPSY